MKMYLWNILITLDQTLNTFTFGSPDETISSRMGKRVRTCKFCYYMCRMLAFVDDKHCEKSIEKDEGRRDVF